MRLVFISSVMATSPWRMISAVITSVRVRIIAPADLDHQISVRADDGLVARQQQGGRPVLVDRGRPGKPVAGEQALAKVHRTVDEPAIGVEVDRPLGALGL